MIEMTEAVINLDKLFGSIEIRSTERIENGVWILGGITIQRDRYGREISRTVQDNLRVDVTGLSRANELAMNLLALKREER